MKDKHCGVISAIYNKRGNEKGHTIFVEVILLGFCFYYSHSGRDTEILGRERETERREREGMTNKGPQTGLKHRPQGQD